MTYKPDIPINSTYTLPFEVGSSVIQGALLGSDALVNDSYGLSLATNGKRIAIGAWEDSSGVVYLFDMSGNELRKISGSNSISGDRFGYSIAMNDDIIVVGAPYEDLNAGESGAVYIFDLDGNELDVLSGSNYSGTGRFGESVAVSNTKIVVGAPGEDPSGTSDAGEVYIFDPDGTEMEILIASDKFSFDQFGMSVAISGDNIVVGAEEAGTGGKAYVFNTSGTELEILIASDTSSGHDFGHSVAISGDNIVVGAWQAGTGGQAYLFGTDGTEVDILIASNAAAGDKFGFAVAIEGSKIIVGAYDENTQGNWSGTCYVYNLIGTETDIFYAPSRQSVSSANFGKSLHMFENVILIGGGYSGLLKPVYLYNDSSINLFDFKR